MDRYTVLSEAALKALGEYARESKPTAWLFQCEGATLHGCNKINKLIRRIYK
jgi:hypothetical protein